MKFFTKYIYLPLFLLLFFVFQIYSQDKDETWIYKWQKSTVSIGFVRSYSFNINGRDTLKQIYKVHGTGVLFYVKFDTVVIPCLVTAKHVLHDSVNGFFPNKIRFRFSWFDNLPVDQYFGIEMPLYINGVQQWIPHSNSSVDLACLPLLKNGEVDFHDTIKVLPYSSIAKDEELYEGVSILVFGYPGAVSDKYSVKAIVRDGIISWVPSIFDFETKILIDCNIFPGNSGSPVFKIPVGFNREGFFLYGGEISFIGIVTGYFRSGTDILTNESLGLGVVEPASRIRELLVTTQNEIKKIIESNQNSNQK